MYRKCGKCGEEIEKTWKYCPFCGSAIGWNIFKRKFMIPGNELGKIFERMVPGAREDVFGGELPRKAGITISIKKGDGSPVVKVRNFNPDSVPKLNIKKTVQINRKIPEEVLEPETVTKRQGSLVVHDLTLPGVKEKDIEVTELENSIEIKAFCRKKMYFKIIEMPHDFSVLEKDFSGSTLSIRVG